MIVLLIILGIFANIISLIPFFTELVDKTEFPFDFFPSSSNVKVKHIIVGIIFPVYLILFAIILIYKLFTTDDVKKFLNKKLF
jgi:hypothetical protein